jgi:hypothetical protein
MVCRCAIWVKVKVKGTHLRKTVRSRSEIENGMWTWRKDAPRKREASGRWQGMDEGGYSRRHEQRREAARVTRRKEGEWSWEEVETILVQREEVVDREEKRGGFSMKRDAKRFGEMKGREETEALKNKTWTEDQRIAFSSTEIVVPLSDYPFL